MSFTCEWTAVDESHMHFGKKPNPKGYLLYDPFPWHSGKGETTETVNRSVVAGLSLGWTPDVRRKA
jgi:hypothetical protein